MDKRKGNRCKAKTKDGKPCRAAATETGLCFFHSNPNKAAELGRKGGRSKRPKFAEDGAPLPSLDTMKSVHEMGKILFVETYSGKLPQKTVNGCVRLLQLLTESIRFTSLAERLAKLEQKTDQSE